MPYSTYDTTTYDTTDDFSAYKAQIDQFPPTREGFDQFLHTFARNNKSLSGLPCTFPDADFRYGLTIAGALCALLFAKRVRLPVKAVHIYETGNKSDPVDVSKFVLTIPKQDSESDEGYYLRSRRASYDFLNTLPEIFAYSDGFCISLVFGEEVPS